jgi:hypothetical protein
VRTIPPAKIRVMGREQKAAFAFNPVELLGGRAAGRLEVQVQDDRAGASDWLPLPATFLELPSIGAVQAEPGGFQLTGPSLDPIEAVAPAREGPWENTAVAIEDGREVARLATPLAGDTCYLKLFGWPDLVLEVKFPPSAARPAAVQPPPRPAPSPVPPPPAPPMPGPARKPSPAPQPEPAAASGDPAGTR